MSRWGMRRTSRTDVCIRRVFNSVSLSFSLLLVSVGGVGNAGTLELIDEGVGQKTNFFLAEMCDETGLGAGIMQMVRLEVEKIYERAGVDIKWIACRHRCQSALESPVEVTVYIRHRLPEKLQKSEGTLALVFKDCNGLPGPVIYVSRSSIERFIGCRRSAATNKLARALGRTIAHELAHRFLKQREHSQEGILRAEFSQVELTQPLAKCFYFARGQKALLQSCARSEQRLRRRLVASEPR